MTRFTLATPATRDGPRAAIGVAGLCHAIGDGELSGKSAGDWLERRDDVFPILARGHGEGHGLGMVADQRPGRVPVRRLIAGTP